MASVLGQKVAWKQVELLPAGFAVEDFYPKEVFDRDIGITIERARAETAHILTQGVPKAKMSRGTASRTPALDQLAIDLTAAARAGKLDPGIGRHKEIERVIQILSRRT